MTMTAWPVNTQTLRRTLMMWAFIAFFACVLPVGVVHADTQAAEEFYEKALGYFVNGELRSARIEARNALQYNPTHLPARVLVGKVHLVHGDGAAAQIAFEQAIRFGASEAGVVLELAQALQMQRKYAELYERIQSGMRKSSEEARIHVALGNAKFSQGEILDAELMFKRAARFAPDLPEAMVGLAAVMLERDEAAQAQQLLERVVAKASDSASAWYLLGQLRRNKGDHDDALLAFDRAVEFDVYHMAARFARARINLRNEALGAVDAELEFLEKIRSSDPQTHYLTALVAAERGEHESSTQSMQALADSLDGLGQAYMSGKPELMLMYGLAKTRQGKHVVARDVLERFDLRYPNHPVALKLLAGMALQRGLADEAIRLLERVRRFVPHDSQLLALLGSAYLKKKDTLRATELLERAVELKPQANDMRTQLAMVRLAVGRGDAAIQELEKILALDTSSTEAAALIGLIHLRRKEFELALKWSEVIAARAPESSSADSLRGAALTGMQRFAEARASYEEVLKRDPDNDAASYNLVELDLSQGAIDLARARLNEILARQPRATRALAQLAGIARRNGDVDEAIRFYERIRYGDPGAVTNRTELVELYLATGRQKDAASLASAMVQRHPDNTRALLAQGRVYMAQQDLGAAAQVFRKMARLVGYKKTELHRIALYQTQANDLEAARWSLDKALQVDADFLPALVLLARLERHSGSAAGVGKLVERIKSAHPEAPQGYTIAADTLREAGQLDAARNEYMSGIARKPSSKLHIGLFLVSLQLAGDDIESQDAAMRVMARWLRDSPGDYVALRHFAGAHIRLRRMQAGIGAYEELLEQQPQDAQIMNALALAYHQVGRTEALALARRALDIAPSSAAVLDTYGWLLVETGDAARALPFLRKARLQAPYASEVRYHLGVTLHALGRMKEAAVELRGALGGTVTFDGQARAQALLDTLTPRS